MASATAPITTWRLGAATRGTPALPSSPTTTAPPDCRGSSSRGSPASGGAGEASLQAKPLRPDEGAEVLAQRLGILPGLVLGPAVELRRAEALDRALAPRRLGRGAPPVIGVDLLGEIALPVAILMQGRLQAEPRRDVSRLGGPAGAHAGDREYPL